MIAKEFPKAEHRHCARHIFANWHKTYKGDEMKLLLWNCAKAYNEADFNDALDAIREVDHKAAETFIACRPHLFCRAFIQTHTKNDVIVNNMAETFNSYIIEARSKHIIYMLEKIRTALMQRLLEKKQEMESGTHVVCPNVQALLEVEKDKAAECRVAVSTPTVFQVAHGIDVLTVDLEARSCTCRKWDLTGISCFHAVAAIFDISALAEDYVHEMYKREAYLRTTAQPTRLGRGGRVIRTARGVAARGRGRGGGGRGGRGGRAPQGFGVLIDESGNAYTNVVGSSSGPRRILVGESTQQSVNQ
ncbi:uncharacterized protein LOC141627704 [Silene latifolia]|uniref:uncharacterized protein LOC141627704 n=1 Tax=Silene latifolia TaxID=37657 RepID=UPI003D786B82